MHLNLKNTNLHYMHQSSLTRCTEALGVLSPFAITDALEVRTAERLYFKELQKGVKYKGRGV